MKPDNKWINSWKIGVEPVRENKTLEELLFEYIYPDDGPLIHHDNETWQKEIDMVSHKIYKFIKMDLNWRKNGKVSNM